MYEVDTRELKIAMAEAGVDTFIAFADAADLDRNTVSGVIKGVIYPSSMVMVKMAEALKLPSERCGRIFFKQKLA